MTGDDRELGEIAARLAAIEELVKELRDERKADHQSIVKLSEAVAVLVARESLRMPAVHPSAAATPDRTGAMTVGAAAGGLAGAAITKIMAWLGIS